MNTVDLFQSVGIIASILIGAWQMRTYTKQQRSAQQQNLMANYNELARWGFEQPAAFSDVFRRPFPKENYLKNRSYYLITQITTVLDQMYIQYSQYSTLSKADWESVWSLSYVWFLTDFGRGYWATLEKDHLLDSMNSDFVALVRTIMAEKDASRSN